MTSIKWPNTGNNSQYFILDVPYLSVGILLDALAFISGHCYYKETHEREKFLKFPGVSPTTFKSKEDTILYENLFVDPDPDGANDSLNKDMYRFQTPPNEQKKLLSCSAIAAILSKVSCVISWLTDVTYVAQKVTVLFSRPRGPEQGLHFDDHRTNAEIENKGELLSVIVALMPNTKIDIGTVNNCRKTFGIPPGAMIIMNGNCLHGGSSYSSLNARLHFEFILGFAGNSTQSLVQNFIATRYRCPLETCQHHKEGHSFDTKTQMYYHWQKEHLMKGTIKLSLKKFIYVKNGGTLVLCSTCGNRYMANKLLSRHRRHCAQVVSRTMDT
jgi:hypothetical protein